MQGFKDIIAYFIERLSRELPGIQSHLRMIPATRHKEFIEMPQEIKRSAVLLLLYPVKEKTYTVFIRRPVYQGYHSGQISLPGGKFCPGDIDLQHTALREASEEVGIDPQKVHIIGPMTELYIPPSQFLLTPFLSYTNEQPDFRPDPVEVQKIIVADVEDFNDKNLRKKDIKLHSGKWSMTPYYRVAGQTIWGATGMIMSEFAEIYGGLLL